MSEEFFHIFSLAKWLVRTGANCICHQIVSTFNRIWRYTFKVELRCAENLQQQGVPFDEEALLPSVVTDKVDISRTELGVPGF